jgi:XTP/dITP diphosphohydrolase
MTNILIATGNPAKIREFSQLLIGTHFSLVTPADEGIDIKVEETGNTFEENARLKASAYASRSHYPVIADDSGLEIDALGGEPGTLSARYAGENAGNNDRIALVLSRLQGVPWEERTARFRCVIAIATPSGEMRLCEGVCPGYITFEPRGDAGFGYDPIFYLPELEKTMAEFTMEEKNQISHRGKAARMALQILQHLP